MRHISLNGFKLPEGWAEKVDELRKKIETVGPAERKKLIKANAALWGELKRELSEYSHGKCWYCETREPRSDRVVDHFRPKNRVAEREDHPGYWWLAFDWNNYRYSCTFCNSLRKSEKDEPAGGKADHFPIIDENRRSCDPKDPIEDELPYLLDPVKNSDTLLLSFDRGGYAVPCYNNVASIHCQRAKKTIEILHLNHPDIREARYAVCAEIMKLITEGDRAFQRQEENPDAALVGNESFESIVRRIRTLVDKTAEYSRAAKAILLDNNKIPWVKSMLQDTN